jgi:PAS domain S-box-containing protein
MLAVAIFLIDTLTPLESAVAVLYVVVILMAARVFQDRGVVLTAIGCIVLTAVAYVVSHGLAHAGSPLLRAIVSVAAIAITTVLALRNRRATARLSEQADLLDLTHDSIFVRNAGDVITFWNRGAEQLYGWTRDEALGQVSSELLRTEFPVDPSTIRAQLLATGRWEGELVQRRKSGAQVVVESRWALQLDERDQQVGTLETNTDITDRKHAHAALVQSERRYRAIFETTPVALLQQDWSGLKAALDELRAVHGNGLAAYLVAHPELIRHARSLVTIVDANDMAIRLFGADRGDLLGATVDDLLEVGEPTFHGALLAIARGETLYEGETEVRTRTGEVVPILFGIAFPNEADGFDRVLAFAVDVTERNQAQEALLAAQAELAHASRVSTLGELTASIAHEVNQPLAAIVTNAEAALRWLRRDVPDLGEVSAAVTRVVADGKRAGAIVSRIRGFLSKAPPRPVPLDVTELIGDATLLVERELARHGVTLRTELTPDLPSVLGDRVQLQQVVVNLMVNGIQAMAGVTGRPRTLDVRACPDGEQVLVEVRDAGHGIAAENLDRLFQPFFTTRNEGMGMGLAICRSTVESHGGRLWASNNGGHGATFSFTLPYQPAEAS